MLPETQLKRDKRLQDPRKGVSMCEYDAVELRGERDAQWDAGLCCDDG